MIATIPMILQASASDNKLGMLSHYCALCRCSSTVDCFSFASHSQVQTSPSPPAAYLMMMEDDFLICDGSFIEIFRFIDIANSRSQRWMGVRASYGLNGIVLNMHDAVSTRRAFCSVSLIRVFCSVSFIGYASIFGSHVFTQPLFESWLAKKVSWKPPDILYTEWVAGVSPA